MKKNVEAYMTPNPISISAETPLFKVINKMETKKVSHLLITDESGGLLGVISKEDVLNRMKLLSIQSSGRTYTQLEMKGVQAEDIMTKNVISVKKEDPLEYAVELLLQKKFHCLPVMEESSVVGIATAFDLLKGYYQEFG